MFTAIPEDFKALETFLWVVNLGSFRGAAHAPSSEKVKEEWEHKYGWEEPHLWDYPMLPTRMVEASCAKCHKQQVYIPNANALNVARQNHDDRHIASLFLDRIH